MTTATRARLLTAWQLMEMMPAHRANLGVGILEQQGEPGELDRIIGGYDFVGASIAVWHGNRRVWALTRCGPGCWMIYLGREHPFCEVCGVGDDDTLEVTERT